MTTSAHYFEAFQNAMMAAGFEPPENIVAGRIVRFDTPERKSGNRRCWYRFDLFPAPHGSFGDWADCGPAHRWNALV